MNRRAALHTLAAEGATGAFAFGAIGATAPAEATIADPLLALVTAYRNGCDAFEANAEHLTDPMVDAMALATWQPSYVAMRDAPPSPTTMHGAAEAIRLVIEEEGDQSSGDDFTANMLRAVLTYLEGRA